MSESNNNAKYYKYSIGCLIITIIAVVLYLLFNNKTIYKPAEDDDSKLIGTLYCSSDNLDNSFFRMDNAINNNHEIKAIYRQQKIDKISYTYTGIFRTEAEADNSDAVLHAKYNKYMAQYDYNPELLAPTFSVIGTKYKVVLYTDFSDIDGAVSGLFFLEPDEISNVADGSVEYLGEIYSRKGLNCEVNNKQKEENDGQN
ncbi:hypothetical protein IJU85_03200 [Candidatus Saccharibacteria bacterium]|nr:hypothetical protein [Candidatus Saccharibacteria bacterium]